MLKPLGLELKAAGLWVRKSMPLEIYKERKGEKKKQIISKHCVTHSPRLGPCRGRTYRPDGIRSNRG